jgi:hypothetical protein
MEIQGLNPCTSGGAACFSGCQTPSPDKPSDISKPTQQEKHNPAQAAAAKCRSLGLAQLIQAGLQHHTRHREIKKLSGVVPAAQQALTWCLGEAGEQSCTVKHLEYVEASANLPLAADYTRNRLSHRTARRRSQSTYLGIKKAYVRTACEWDPACPQCTRCTTPSSL